MFGSAREEFKVQPYTWRGTVQEVTAMLKQSQMVGKKEEGI